VWREGLELLSDGSVVVETKDPIDVLENVMRYFYAMALHGVKAKAPVEDVARYFSKAGQFASLAAPYRHPRLSAVKHMDVAARALDGIRVDATPDEIRAEIAKRVKQLRDEGYLDIDALPEPQGIAPAADGAVLDAPIDTPAEKPEKAE
jgi:hypothetical protein